MLVRLQKLLADAGVASRRASEQIILEGRVTVNGRKTTELGHKVEAGTAVVSVDGVEVKRKKKLYLALNKPRRVLCSRKDPLTRRAVEDLIPKEWAHLQTVGRLDLDSEGLIFLTNDGDFSLRLTHPKFGVMKKYLATVEGLPDPGMLARMRRGIVHQGTKLKAEKVRVLKASVAQSLVELVLREGKNREVRRLFESQGMGVLRLQRVQIGPIKLGELREGKWRILTDAEVRSLTRDTAEEKTTDSARH